MVVMKEKIDQERVRKPSATLVALDAYKAECAALGTVEEKLIFTVGQMTQALSQGGTPLFKFFWELRKVCAELFKEPVSPIIRSQQWARYQELSKEARRLKGIFDEKSAFAAEQIEIAIQEIEAHVANVDARIGKAPLAGLGQLPHALKGHDGYFRSTQGKLLLLNADAARVNTLRKELVKTEMRVAVKNKFFERLSKAGDSIFPQRKELIQELSQAFVKEVDTFVETQFSDERLMQPLHQLRDEIKRFQGMAKVLTLNTQAFAYGRKQLSECWEKCKEVGKELKKEVAAKKLQAEKKLAEEKARQEQENKKRELQRAAFNKLSDEIKGLQKAAPTLAIAELQQQRTALAEAVEAEVLLLSNQVSQLKRKLRPIDEVIEAKREEELLSLSGDDKEKLLNYREVLKQRRERRKEVKEQLDSLRKEASGSGFDIERSLQLHDQIVEEEQRLESADQAIEEIAEKLALLKREITSRESA